MTSRSRIEVVITLVVMVVVSACDMGDMYQQPKYKAYAKSDLFEDQRSARPLVPGTVARGHAKNDDLFFTGTAGGKASDVMPFAVSQADLLRGKERYNIYCAPCHAQTGLGNGMVVQRGFEKPPSLHSIEVKKLGVGFYFQVISNGFRDMPAYGDLVSFKDRWLIAAYIRALQLSNAFPVSELSPQGRQKVEGSSK